MPLPPDAAPGPGEGLRRAGQSAHPAHFALPCRAAPRPSSTEISVDSRKTSRRSFLSLAISTPLAGALAACGGRSGPTHAGAGGGAGGGGGGGGGATFWFLSGQPDQSIREDTVKRFNSSGGGNIAFTEFQNDAYKTKIKT